MSGRSSATGRPLALDKTSSNAGGQCTAGTGWAGGVAGAFDPSASSGRQTQQAASRVALSGISPQWGKGRKAADRGPAGAAAMRAAMASRRKCPRA